MVGELSSTAQRRSSVQQGLYGGCLKRRVYVLHTDIDRFQLGVVVQRHAPVLPANARELVAAYRHFRRGFAITVDPADTRLDLVNHPVSTADVVGEHAGGQAGVGIVGRAITSSSSRKVSTDITGPKISSRTMVMSSVQSVKMVGSTK